MKKVIIISLTFLASALICISILLGINKNRYNEGLYDYPEISAVRGKMMYLFKTTDVYIIDWELKDKTHYVYNVQIGDDFYQVTYRYSSRRLLNWSWNYQDYRKDN